jgi:hypothetical protein
VEKLDFISLKAWLLCLVIVSIDYMHRPLQYLSHPTVPYLRWTRVMAVLRDSSGPSGDLGEPEVISA